MYYILFCDNSKDDDDVAVVLINTSRSFLRDS